MHALTGRAALEAAPADQLRAAARAAAEALAEAWPDPDQAVPQASASFRANIGILADHSGDALWQPDGHPVLFRAGNSPARPACTPPPPPTGSKPPAIAPRILGPSHPHTLNTRVGLASSYQLAWRTGDAITLFEQVTADRARTLGPDHPDTLNARSNLASSYRQAGRTAEAIALGEQFTADHARILGPTTPHPLNSCGKTRLTRADH